MRTRLTLASAAVVLAGCAQAAPTHIAAVTPTPDAPTRIAAVAPTPDPPPSEQDRAWLWAVHEGNLAEVRAGRLAQGKGMTTRIKSIGGILLQDHVRLDGQVVETARRLEIKLPTSPSAEQRAEIARLRDATGRDFDEDFLAAMAKEHLAAIAAAQEEISGGSSRAVVALARAVAPKLQGHLAAVRKADGS